MELTLSEKSRINICISSSSFFPVTGHQPSGLLRSLAISLEVSLLTVFLRGRKEATVLVVRKVPFDLYAAANLVCIDASILLWVLISVPLVFLYFIVQKIDNNDMPR